jgi:hypothetical protein
LIFAIPKFGLLGPFSATGNFFFFFFWSLSENVLLTFSFSFFVTTVTTFYSLVVFIATILAPHAVPQVVKSLKSMRAFAFVFVLSALLAIDVNCVHVEVGDAGEAGIAQAQAALLNGPSDSITGTIIPSTDVDLFSFCVTDPSAFSATTAGTATTETVNDTQLFVFNSLGEGIVGNDDIEDDSDDFFRSHITSATFVANGGQAGLNYIAVSAFDLDPRDSTNGFIFLNSFPGQLDPIIPNAVLSHFDGKSTKKGGSYKISLTGVGPCPVTASGDPHLAGAHGITFDVYGKPAANYSLLVAPAFEVNMQLADRGPKMRFMASMAVLYQGKSFIINPWTLKGKRAELIAHFEALGAKVSIDAHKWTITIELCAQHTISFTTHHSHDINYLNFEVRVPGCHDAYGGLLGQTYQCKYAHEKFEWSREREEAFRVATLETASEAYAPLAECAHEDEYRGEAIRGGSFSNGTLSMTTMR